MLFTGVLPHATWYCFWCFDNCDCIASHSGISWHARALFVSNNAWYAWHTSQPSQKPVSESIRLTALLSSTLYCKQSLSNATGGVFLCATGIIFCTRVVPSDTNQHWQSSCFTTISACITFQYFRFLYCLLIPQFESASLIECVSQQLRPAIGLCWYTLVHAGNNIMWDQQKCSYFLRKGKSLEQSLHERVRG